MIQEVDIERVTEEESEYVKQLRSKYSKKEIYGQRLGVVKKFLAQNDLDLRSLTEFHKNEDIGVIYVLVEERFRTLHHNLVRILLDGLNANPNKKEEAALVASFKETFPETYLNFLKEKREGALLLETVCRKLFQEGIERWLLRNRVDRAKKSLLVSEVSARIDAILTPLRLGLAKNENIDVFLLSETFTKVPLIPSPLSTLTLGDMEAELLKYGLTPGLFEKVTKRFQISIQEELEVKVLNSLKKKPIKSKLDIARGTEWPIYSISSEGVEKIKYVIAERLGKRFIDLTQELKRLNQEWERKKERFERAVTDVTFSTRKALTTLAREELRDCMESLGRMTESIAAEMEDLQTRKEEVEAELRMAKNLQGLTAQELTSLILKKGRREIERYFHTYRALSDKFGRELKTAPDGQIESFSELIKDELELLRSKPSPQYEIIRKLEERRFWKKHYNVNELKARWLRMCTQLLEPLVITKYIEEIVRIWPPMVPERALTQPFLTEARYVGEELAFNDRLYHLQTPSRPKRIKKGPQLDEVRRFMVDNFREVVSVLVYDIRGSTFMGNRLNNARKESDIRNNFNIRMMQIARRHGAFVVKDTGDGGILFFSGNSPELERRCLESGNRSHPGESGLVPSRESARKAIECARDMVKGAFNFVEDNLEQYGDWFEDVRKESLRYAGISYAQLPPEYKRIFKVGIGIASGRPDVDIYFGQNGFGSPDITGGLVREANFYSKARSKERSIILCDGTTLLSFLLNVDQYEPQGTLPVRTRSPAGESLSELLLEAMWNYARLKEQKSGYKFGKLGVFIERVGAQIYYEKELESTFSLTCSGLDITSSGEFLDERNRKVKILYQIIPEWMKG